MLHSSANLSTETLRSEKSVQIIYNIAVDLLFAEQEKSAVVFLGFIWIGLARCQYQSLIQINGYAEIDTKNCFFSSVCELMQRMLLKCLVVFFFALFKFENIEVKC